MAASERDLMARFIANEKKAKTTTILSVGGFLALTMIIIYLMFALKGANEGIEREKSRADLALAKADSLLNALETQRTGVAIRSEEVVELPTYITGDDSVNSAIANKPRIYIGTSASMNNKPVLGNIKAAGRVTTRKSVTKKSPAVQKTVYIQYKKNYEAIGERLGNELKKWNFDVPKSELVVALNYASTVKYFYDTDKPLADSIARQLNTYLASERKSSARVVKNDIKAPPGQLEVWLGDYVRPKTSDLLKRYEP